MNKRWRWGNAHPPCWCFPAPGHHLCPTAWLPHPIPSSGQPRGAQRAEWRTPIPCPCRRLWWHSPATKALSQPAAVLERARGASSLTAGPSQVQALGAHPPLHQTNYTSCIHCFRVRKNNNTPNKGPPQPCLEESRRWPGKPPSEQAAEPPGATGRGQAPVCASRAPAGPSKLDVKHLENSAPKHVKNTLPSAHNSVLTDLLPSVSQVCRHGTVTPTVRYCRAVTAGCGVR